MTLKANECDKLAKGMSLPITDDITKYDWDTTGDGSERKAKVQAIYDGENFIQSADSSKDIVGLVLDNTPLYAEQGGQTFDTAEIVNAKGVEFSVSDAQKYAGYVLHCGAVSSGGEIKVGDEVTVKVDFGRRALVAKNHTATHVLNFALRQVLGEKIDQKGSLVDHEKLRFDFNASIDFFGILTIDAFGWIDSRGNFDVTLEGRLELGGGGFGVFEIERAHV